MTTNDDLSIMSMLAEQGEECIVHRYSQDNGETMFVLESMSGDKFVRIGYHSRGDDQWSYEYKTKTDNETLFWKENWIRGESSNLLRCWSQAGLFLATKN